MPYDRWYETLDQSDVLYQGDFLEDCLAPIILSELPLEAAENQEIDVDLQRVNLVILTQTCDLEHNHVANILLAEYFPWDAMVEREVARGNDAIKGTQYKKLLSEGGITNLFLLPPHEQNPVLEWSVVNFRLLHTLPREYMKRKATAQTRRLRLASPYREYLSQAFARFTMRVALDETLEYFHKPQAQLPTQIGTSAPPLTLPPGQPGS